jgi:hypothetical protein
MTGNAKYRLVLRPLRPALVAANTDSSACLGNDTPEARFGLFHSHLITSTLSTLSTPSTSTFSTLLCDLFENSATYDLVGLARILPLPHA